MCDVKDNGDMELADWMHSGLLFSHSFIKPCKHDNLAPKQPKVEAKVTFFVFGNLKLGSSGSTAAATRRHAEERGVSGEEFAEFELQSTSRIGDWKTAQNK